MRLMTYLCNRACRIRSAGFGGPARPVAIVDHTRNGCSGCGGDSRGEAVVFAEESMTLL